MKNKSKQTTNNSEQKDYIAIGQELMEQSNVIQDKLGELSKELTKLQNLIDDTAIERDTLDMVVNNMPSILEQIQSRWVQLAKIVGETEKLIELSPALIEKHAERLKGIKVFDIDKELKTLQAMREAQEQMKKQQIENKQLKKV